MVYDALVFLSLWQVKHFVCDFLLQNRYMLGKFKKYPDFILPLVAHSAVQALGTYAIAGIVLGSIHVFYFCLFDFITHFIIDRIKASPKLLGRWKPEDKEFWWTLGFDQMLHHMVGVTIAIVIYLR